MLSHRREIGPMYQKSNSFDGKIFSLNHFCTFDVFLALHLIKCEIEKQLQTSTVRRVIYRRALRPFCNGSELALKSLLHNGTTHVSWINVADCAHYRRGVVGGGGGGVPVGLHGRFGVAVRRQTLDVNLGDGQLVGDVVSVLNGRSLWKSLTERGLFLQHRRQGRIASLAITSI